jgi:hypothetical protein
LSTSRRRSAPRSITPQPSVRIWEAGRAIDVKYKPLIALTATWAAKLRTAFEGFLKAEERRQQEVAEKAFEAKRAAAEAERKRIDRRSREADAR